MKVYALTIGIALVVAGCGAPPPASSAPEPQLALQLDPPPVHALIGHRAQLDLTSEQIETLDELGQEIHTENHPLLMQLQEIDYERTNVVMRQEMMKLAGQIHVNNHRMMERVRNTLTDEQRREACALFPAGQTTRALRSSSGSDYGLRTVSRPTTYVNVGPQRTNGSIWNWCSELETTTAAR